MTMNSEFTLDTSPRFDALFVTNYPGLTATYATRVFTFGALLAEGTYRITFMGDRSSDLGAAATANISGTAFTTPVNLTFIVGTLWRAPAAYQQRAVTTY